MFRIVALAALLPLSVAAAATAQVLEHRQVMRQSNFFTSPHAAIRADSVCLNGSYVLGGHTLDMEEFISIPEEDVREWLKLHLVQSWGHLSHITEHLNQRETPVFYLILDIEHQKHPGSLWKLWDPEYTPTPLFTKQEVADAFSMRLRVAQEVFDELFPWQDTRVGLFGMPKTQPSGLAGPAFLAQRENLIELASLGMVDHADFLVPLLYARYASTDPRYSKGARYAMLGLDSAAMMRRSDGSQLPLMPLLTIRIYNGSQPSGLARVSWHQDVIEAIRTSGHWIEAIAFWLDPSERDECVLAYFDRLFAPQDWNYDCLSDSRDDHLVSSAISTSDAMADLNGDDLIDQADWDFYRAAARSAPPTVACGSAVDCPCTMDFFDFLDFQALFALGDPAADINGDGVLDFFDFIAFQQRAANPCP